MSYVDECLNWLMGELSRYEETTGNKLLSYTEVLNLSADQIVTLYGLCNESYDAAFLTGAAGTGKTYTVKLLKELLTLRGYAVHRTAATGVASQLVGGCTIHSFLGLRGFDVVPGGYFEYPDCCTTGSPRRPVASCVHAAIMSGVPKPTLLVVDEVSMLSAEQLVLIYQAAQLCHNSRKENQHPLRFLLVGDLRQLAVVPGKTWYPCHHHYCFEDAVFELRTNPPKRLVYGSFFTRGPFPEGDQRSWQFRTYGLYHQHRQSQDNKAFQEALYYLGRGHDLRHPAVSFLQSRVYVPDGKGGWVNNEGHRVLVDEDLSEATHLFMRNGSRVKGKENPWHWKDTVGEYNEKVCERLRRSKARCRTYRASIEPGEWTVDEIIDYVKPIPPEITLYEGMRFLCRHNYIGAIANGTMTRIVALHKDSIDVEVIETGARYTLVRVDLPLPSLHDRPVGKFTTCAFGQVGNAMTFWACQGMTLKKKRNAQKGEDCLVVHLEKRPRKVQGLFYVACSRVEYPEQLYIFAHQHRDVNEFIYCDPKVLQVLDEAEQATRKLTGESANEQIICRLERMWETLGGHAYSFHTSLSDIPNLTLFYDEQGNLTGCSREEDYFVPVEPPSELLDACQALIVES